MLAEMHLRLHILHRDIKPQNILVTQSGIPRIIDFSLASVFSTSLTPCSGPVSQTGRVVTRWYRPPELLKAELDGKETAVYGSEVDIWSMGVVLAEIWCPTFFKDVFVQPTVKQTLQSILNSFEHLDYNEIHTLKKTEPDVYDLIFCKMMVIDPFSRIDSKNLLLHPEIQNCRNGISPIPELTIIHDDWDWMNTFKKSDPISNMHLRKEKVKSILQCSRIKKSFKYTNVIKAATIEFMDHLAMFHGTYEHLNPDYLVDQLVFSTKNLPYNNIRKDGSAIDNFQTCMSLDLIPFLRSNIFKVANNILKYNHETELWMSYKKQIMDDSFHIRPRVVRLMNLLESIK